jgi:UDP-glucose 4-epimerase
MPRVVVTGASGFIGGAICARLRRHGFDVVGLHRQPHAAAGEVSVTDYAQSPGGDVLIHLAEVGDRGKVARLGPKFVTDVTERLRALLDGRYGHIVYASSSLVYAFAETPRRVGDPVDRTEYYAQGKLACEAMALDAGGTVLRFSNVYGPEQAGETVINAIRAQLPGHGPIVLRDLSPVRDFLAVEDAAAALEMAVRRRQVETLNIGTGVGTSIGGLLKIMLELHGTPHREMIATSPGVPTTFVLDVTDTTKKTG